VRECRAIPGATVVTNARAFYTPRAASGATGTRHSPRPLFSKGEWFMQNSGASRREIGEAVSSRHCEERSDEAIQSFFLVALWIASLRSQ
jgi:hypothetical protein